jgi:YbbR domain-containing protein
MSWLLKNWEQKLIALLLSLVFWAVVRHTVGEGPRRVFTNLPLREVGLPEDLRIVRGETVVEVEARALGDASVLDQIRGEDLRVEVDLRNAKPGEGIYDVVLRKTRFDGMVEFTPRPAKVRLVIERYVSMRMPISVEQIGEGPMLKSSEWTLGMERVTVRGAESQLLEARRAVVRVDQGSVSPGQSYELPVLILDESGRVLDVTVDPARVRFTVLPRALLTSAMAPVQVDWRGSVPFGYRIVDYTIEPPVVEVSGDANRMQGLRVVLTEPLDLTSVRSSTTKTLRVVVAEGLSCIPSEVRVTVRVARSQ